MQFQHARCDERRGSFHVVRVISNLLFRPIHHYNSPACAGNFPELRGDIFTCSISRGVAETYSRKRVYNCSYTDSKLKLSWGADLLLFVILSYVLCFSFFCFYFSFFLSVALFMLILSSILFLISHERSVFLAYYRKSRTTTKSEL